MPSFYKTFALVATMVTSACAIMVPTSPDGSTVARVGSTLTALWDLDTTGTWTQVTIQLMTGDNFQMIPVQTLATGIDATTLDEFSFTVPAVTPTSKIYFLQFSDPIASTEMTWTTRFTIAAADGTTTTPENPTQPGGANIPWGVGSLVGGSTATLSSAGAISSSTLGTITSTTSTSSSTTPTTTSTLATAVDDELDTSIANAAVTSTSAVNTGMFTLSRGTPTTTREFERVSATASEAVPDNGVVGRANAAGMGFVGVVVGALSFML